MQHRVDLIRLSKSRILFSTKNTNDVEDLTQDKTNTPEMRKRNELQTDMMFLCQRR